MVEHLTFNQVLFKGRILGFSHHWDKLNNPQFTTFRFPRKDKDWYVDELVQIVYKPRSKEREVLGIAQIIDKNPKFFGTSTPRREYWITDNEANVDGFKNYREMEIWFYKQYGEWIFLKAINKLTLQWIEKRQNSPDNVKFPLVNFNTSVLQFTPKEGYFNENSGGDSVVRD